MENSRSRAVRAIANHTRKRARVVIDAKDHEQWGNQWTDVIADVQIVGEDNQWQSYKHCNFYSYGPNIRKYTASDAATNTQRLLQIVIDMTLEGYIFSDGVVYSDTAACLRRKTLGELINEAEAAGLTPTDIALSFN